MREAGTRTRATGDRGDTLGIELRGEAWTLTGTQTERIDECPYSCSEIGEDEEARTECWAEMGGACCACSGL